MCDSILSLTLKELTLDPEGFGRKRELLGVTVKPENREVLSCLALLSKPDLLMSYFLLPCAACLALGSGLWVSVGCIYLRWVYIP